MRKVEMTPKELQVLLHRLGLQVPEAEVADIAQAIPFLEEMRASVRKLRSEDTKPAHGVAFTQD